MEFSSTTICKGCRHEFRIYFTENEYWREHKHKVQCPNCDSELEAQCQKDMIGVTGKIYTRTKMLKHTEKLLGMLKET